MWVGIKMLKELTLLATGTTTLTLGGGKNYDGNSDPDVDGSFQVTLWTCKRI